MLFNRLHRQRRQTQVKRFVRAVGNTQIRAILLTVESRNNWAIPKKPARGQGKGKRKGTHTHTMTHVFRRNPNKAGFRKRAL